MAKPYGHVMRGSDGTSKDSQSQARSVSPEQTPLTDLPAIYYLLSGLQLVTVLAGFLGVLLASPAGQRTLFGDVVAGAGWNIGFLAQVLIGTAFGVALFGTGATVIRLLSRIEKNTRPQSTANAGGEAG